MEVLTATICDFAEDYQGKLCILGAFDTIGAAQFPGKHPHCAIALRLLFRDEDQGHHEMTVAFVDGDGRSVVPDFGPRLDVDVPEIPENTFFLSRNFVLNIGGLPLPAAGIYSFDIAMDGTFIARIPLQVVQAPFGAPNPGPSLS